ncbi:hypothetical protein ACFVIM_09010 [Streptomyces sp. NPDC057638]|uniref:hypothetical protein n=1 Tax=Streptomyces sp. NPDC057638 TaxID=3346190 RepID=UPI003685CAC5
MKNTIRLAAGALITACVVGSMGPLAPPALASAPTQQLCSEQFDDLYWTGSPVAWVQVSASNRICVDRDGASVRARVTVESCRISATFVAPIPIECWLAAGTYVLTSPSGHRYSGGTPVAGPGQVGQSVSASGAPVACEKGTWKLETDVLIRDRIAAQHSAAFGITDCG